MKRISLLLLPLFSMLLSSCGAVIITPDNNLKILKRAVPHYKAGQSLSIYNYYKKPTIAKDPVQARHIEVDLQQFSEAVINLVKQGMAYQNIAVVPSNKKTIKIRVHNVKWINFTGVRLEITAELSNGNLINVHHLYTKRGYYSEMYNRVIIPATEKLLKHPDFIKFMN